MLANIKESTVYQSLNVQCCTENNSCCVLIFECTMSQVYNVLYVCCFRCMICWTCRATQIGTRNLDARAHIQTVVVDHQRKEIITCSTTPPTSQITIIIIHITLLLLNPEVGGLHVADTLGRMAMQEQVGAVRNEYIFMVNTFLSWLVITNTCSNLFHNLVRHSALSFGYLERLHVTCGCSSFLPPLYHFFFFWSACVTSMWRSCFSNGQCHRSIIWAM